MSAEKRLIMSGSLWMMMRVGGRTKDGHSGKAYANAKTCRYMSSWRNGYLDADRPLDTVVRACGGDAADRRPPCGGEDGDRPALGSGGGGVAAPSPGGASAFGERGPSKHASRPAPP